jgi:hypothetical protein
MRKNRKSIRRKPKKIIKILCEGDKTEPIYFNGIFNNNPSNKKNYILSAYKPKDNSPKGIVKAAKEEKIKAIRDKISEKDFFIWAVFDRNGHEGISEAFDMADANEIKIIFSSICFEFWILLHYTRTSRPFTNCNELISYIKKHYDAEFEKRNDHYEHLKQKIHYAICNGEWLNQQLQNDLNAGSKVYELNPYTNANELVNFLSNL